MKKRALVFEIAKWEFHRWFKWKDQIVSLLISAGLGAVLFGGSAFLKDDDAALRLAIIGKEFLPLEISAESRLVLQHAEAHEEQRLRERVGRREIEGLLLLKNSEEAELLVYKEPFWKKELEEYLHAARSRLKIRQLQIPAEQLAEATRSVVLTLTIHEGGHVPTSTAEKITAGLTIGIMLLGIFMGAAYQFVAITGEKQLRVTEMIVSAVSPQQWIDGKILGVSAYALAFTLTTVCSVLLFVLVARAFGSGWTIPMEVTSPAIILALLLLALAGFLFWNTIFAAVSATINDPNTSARGSLLLLPFAPVGFAVFAFKNPDTLAMKILSLIPFTSPTVLPARLVLTEVAWWEVALALLVLGASTWFFRTASGKIFRLGMLMHGKEPSFKEMWRWAREK